MLVILMIYSPISHPLAGDFVFQDVAWSNLKSVTPETVLGTTKSKSWQQHPMLYIFPVQKNLYVITNHLFKTCCILGFKLIIFLMVSRALG